MRRCSVLNVILLALALSSSASEITRAAATVGEARHFETGPLATAELQQLAAEYKRPETIPFPVSNPYTAAKAALGRALFHDPRLSDSGALSCASCHNPGFSYGNGQAKGIGNRTNPLDRRSPSIVNSAWGNLFMWDGRATTLEEQVAGPIENTSEMNQPLVTLTKKLAGISGYQQLFSTAFPNQSVTIETISSAIATYERTIVSSISPFDKWIDGDETAVTYAAKRGFVLFNAKARCASCHNGWLFTDDGFHDIGLPDDDDLGRGRLFPQIGASQHAFKTPSLRETALRAPYMHDGSLQTLEAVASHYNQGGIERPSRSELITPLGLSHEEQADIVAFLQTLSSDVRLDAAPVLPR